MSSSVPATPPGPDDRTTKNRPFRVCCIPDVLGEAAALDRIIQAEKSHIVRLMKYILTDEKMKGLADVF